MSHSVCAVIVTFNRLEILKQSLACITAQTLQPACIVVVENNSTDGTKEYLQTIDNTGTFRCLFMDENVGWSGGLESGIRYGETLGKFNFFWMMDDDSFHVPTALQSLVNIIQKTDCAIIGNAGFNMKYNVKQNMEAKDTLQYPDVILMDGALVKAEAVAIAGTPDAKFFIMCDDIEYCKRLRKNGFKVGLLQMPDTTRLYMGSGKFTKSSSWRGYYHSRNHMLILKDYFSLTMLMGYVVTQSKYLLAAAVLAPDRRSRVKLRLMGMWHGLRGVGGRSLDPATLKFRTKKTA